MSDQKADAKAIFLKALDCAGPHDLSRFLDDACGADAALRARVEALLRANQDAGAFLGGAEKREPTREEPIAERPGAIIGSYKLLESIGEGGFGVVFMAEQTEPIRRKVALKVLKPGMDTRQVIARFEAERQALAPMDHSNIARVFDGGQTSSGRPYFVMELVRGTPITEYCDENHLTIRQRLELFINVCQAVQHAHQKGIIHRDLKPSNVLIASHDGTPVVKVIDFGIAKAITGPLTDKTLFTGFAQMIGTPLYMSPEQAEQSSLDVDTRSDIYSLGVLLYELLTGATPFDSEVLKKAGFDEMRRIIREDEPPRPSTRFSTLGEATSTASAKRRSDPRRLSQLIRGELDWIAMKALDKDRNRRYETANAFAMDVQRYLADEPVAAGPPSFGYRMRKFLKRNRSAAAAVAIVVIALVGGIVGATWGMLEARESERFASKETEEKTKALNKAVEDFNRAEKAEQDTRNALAKEQATSGKLDGALLLHKNALYSLGIHLADREWFANNLAGMQNALKTCPPDKRHWEWQYLASLPHRDLHTLHPPQGMFSAVAVSKDGSRLATLNDFRNVSLKEQKGLHRWLQIWDTRTGQQIHRCAFFPENNRTLLQWHSLEFAPDGKRLYAASGEGWLVLDAETGNEVFAKKAPPKKNYSGRLALSPDGTRLAQVDASTGMVSLLNAETGAVVKRFPAKHGRIAGMAYHPKGTHVALHCGESAVLVSLETGLAVHTINNRTRQAIPNARTNAPIAFHPSGEQIAVGWADRIAIYSGKVWTETGTIKDHSGLVHWLAFSEDGSRLFSGSHDRTIRAWSVNGSTELLSLRGHYGPILDGALSQDGRLLATTSTDKTVKIWDTTKGAECRIIAPRKPREGKTMSVRFAGMITVVRTPPALGLEPQVLVERYDPTTAKKVQEFSLKGLFRSFDISPDGKRLVLTSIKDTLHLWDLDAGREIHTVASPSAFVMLGFAANGKDLVASHVDGSLQILDAATLQPKSLLKPNDPVRGKRMSVSPAGDLVAITHTIVGDVSVISLAAGKERWKVSDVASKPFQSAFSPDGRWLAVAALMGPQEVGSIRLFDLKTGKVAKPMQGFMGGLRTLTFSSDRKRLFSGGYDRLIRIWNVDTGLELLALRGHDNEIMDLALSPDGNRLVSMSSDGEVRLWDASPPAKHADADAE